MKFGSGARRQAQRGGFVLGMIVGLLVGLAIALGVALYIAKVPVPFMDKVGHRTPEQEAQEAEKLKTWDPNAGLAGKQAPRPVPAASEAGSAPLPYVGGASSPVPVAVMGAKPASAAKAASAAAPAPAEARSKRDPAAILSGAPVPAHADKPAEPAAAGPDPFIYFVQAGAYSNANDAEQQRARLAMQGLVAKVSEREQAGRNVYRVRLGPFDSRDEAERQQDRLKGAGMDSALVRVERSKGQP